MQLPSVDRTVNGPAAGTDSQPAAGGAAAGAGTVPRATREETRVLQERAIAAQPEPSIRVELSAEADALIRSGRAAEDEAGAAAGAVMVAASAAAGSSVQGDRSATGSQKSSIEAATEAFEQRMEAEAAAPTAETAQALGRYQATGQKPGPDQPSGPDEAAPKNWTEKPKIQEEKPPEPPKEPISKKLLDFLQSLWRAGGNAIDVAQNGNLVLNPPKDADSPVTYADPSAKKTTGL